MEVSKLTVASYRSSIDLELLRDMVYLSDFDEIALRGEAKEIT